MNTSQFDTVPADERSVLARVLVVAGTLVGFGVLAVLLSGTANASERSPDQPDRPGLLSVAGKPLQNAVKPAGPVLRSVTDVVHTVSSQVAPAVTPVTALVEPVLAPVTRPVVKAVAPVLSVVRPVTEPVVHVVGADPAVKAVAGTMVTAPRDDVQPAPVEQRQASTPAVTSSRLESDVAAVPEQPRAERSPNPGTVVGRDAASRMSGSEGGGSTPPAPAAPAASGAVSASSAGQHGGESGVTEPGSGVPGTDRTWRAPPGGHAPLYWLVFYGNDHPS